MTPRLVVVAGTVAVGLLQRVGDHAKAIAAIVVLTVGAYGAGTYIALKYAEQRDYAPRLDRMEAGLTAARAGQDSLRDIAKDMAAIVIAVKADHDTLSQRLIPLEQSVAEIPALVDRVERVICILQGLRGPSCI